VPSSSHGSGFSGCRRWPDHSSRRASVSLIPSSSVAAVQRRTERGLLPAAVRDRRTRATFVLHRRRRRAWADAAASQIAHARSPRRRPERDERAGRRAVTEPARWVRRPIGAASGPRPRASRRRSAPCRHPAKYHVRPARTGSRADGIAASTRSPWRRRTAAGKACPPNPAAPGRRTARPGDQQPHHDRTPINPRSANGCTAKAVGLVGLGPVDGVAQARDPRSRVADSLEQRMLPTSSPLVPVHGRLEPNWVSRADVSPCPSTS